MKIAVVSCYKQTNYGRARTLKQAVDKAAGIELIDIHNTRRNWLRYLEVFCKLTAARFRDKPDAYVMTFRGYELLLFSVLTGIRKPIIFDELVNFTEWMEEHDKLRAGSLAYKLFQAMNGWFCRHCHIILADTDEHAAYSARLNDMPMERYRTVVVGTDEAIFQPQPAGDHSTEPFTVFYYGSKMLPLHGLDCVLAAAVLVKDEPEINFHIVGGKKRTIRKIKQAIDEGARITYDAWLPLKDLAAAAAKANIALGGPFGNTIQSQYIITGKTYQSLAVGVPVVIGKNQVQSLFIDKQNCLAIPQADSQALAECIMWAQTHPQALHKIGVAGRLLYEQYFSQAVINKQIAAVLAEL